MSLRYRTLHLDNMDNGLTRAQIQRMIDDTISQSQYGVTNIPLHTHSGVDGSQKIPAANILPSISTLGNINLAQNAQAYSIGLNVKPVNSFKPSLIRFNGIAVFATSTFTVTSANATLNAVYEYQNIQFTVTSTITGGTTLQTNGPGWIFAPASGSLTRVSGSGDNFINFSSITSTITIRALAVGDAYLGQSYYLQPLTTNSVTVGGPTQPVIQCCSYIIINNSGSGPATQAQAGEGHIVDVSFNGSIVARATIPDLGDFGTDAQPIQNGNLIVNVTLAAGWAIQGNFLLS
jgi:hypothetical protein